MGARGLDNTEWQLESFGDLGLLVGAGLCPANGAEGAQADSPPPQITPPSSSSLPTRLRPLSRRRSVWRSMTFCWAASGSSVKLITPLSIKSSITSSSTRTKARSEAWKCACPALTSPSLRKARSSGESAARNSRQSGVASRLTSSMRPSSSRLMYMEALSSGYTVHARPVQHGAQHGCHGAAWLKASARQCRALVGGGKGLLDIELA